MTKLEEKLKGLSPAKRELVLRQLRAREKSRTNKQRAGSQPPPRKRIPRLKNRVATPLSFTQQRLWFLDCLDGPNASYIVPFCLRFRGVLQRDALEKALAAIVNRHEVLRSIYQMKGGVPTQILVPQLRIEPEFEDLSQLQAAEQDAILQKTTSLESTRPFDLEKGPLMRVTILKMAAEAWFLLIGMHHIVSDGWSVALFIHELSTLYQAESKGIPAPLPPLAIQYADFAVWQRTHLAGERLEALQNYWGQELRDLLPLEIPSDFPRPAIQDYSAGHLDFSLLPATSSALKRLAKHHAATLFMPLLTVFMAFLQRYSGQNDIAVATPMANRTRAELEPLIGFFANTVILRAHLEGSASFKSILEQVRKKTMAAFKYQEMPFDLLVEALAPERDLARNPLAGILFALQNAHQTQSTGGDSGFEVVQIGNPLVRFDMELHMVEAKNALHGRLIYKSGLFSQQTVEGWVRSLKALFEAFVADPSADMSLALLEAKARSQGWGQNKAVSPGAVAEFQTWAKRTPQAPALYQNGQWLTYAELDQDTDKLAKTLRSEHPFTRVALDLPFGSHWLRAALAMMKLGVGLVPLEHEAPKAWKIRILRGCKVDGVLRRDHETTDELRFAPLEAEGKVTADRSTRKTLDGNEPYWIVPTGTTCSEISDADFAHQLRLILSEWPLDPHDRILISGAVSMPFLLTAAFTPLICGASVVAYPQKSTLEIVSQMATLGIAAAWLPTPAKVLHEPVALPELRWCFWGGGPPEEGVYEQWRSMTSARLIRLFCLPAKPGIFAWQDCREPAAWLHPGAFALQVVDPEGCALPFGAPGQVEILEDDGKSARLSQAGCEMMNLSGRIRWDHCLELDESTLWIEHRLIETTQVEIALLALPQIGDVVVRARRTRCSSTLLCAYFTSRVSLEPSFLRALLSEQLPEWMIPKVMIQLTHMPLTGDGEVDVQRLRDLESIDSELIHRCARDMESQRGIGEVFATTVPRIGDQTVKKPKTMEDIHRLPAGDLSTEELSQPAPLAISHGPELRVPGDAPSCLGQALLRAERDHAQHGIILAMDGQDPTRGRDGQDPTRISYAMLAKKARETAVELQQHGAQSGDFALLVMDRLADYFSAFWACQFAGMIPLTLSAERLKRGIHQNIKSAWRILEKPIIISDLPPDIFENALGAQPGLILNPGQSRPDEISVKAFRVTFPEPGATAFLQQSSGSTGAPKLIRLTHEGVLSYVLTAGNPKRVMLNWFPLDHVVPLTAFHIAGVYMGCDQVHASTELVLEDPLRWLSLMEANAVTHSWAPNFAFRLVANRLEQTELRPRLDSVQSLVNAGEQVTAAAVAAFLGQAGTCGLDRRAVQPAFGMAETCTCITYNLAFNPHESLLRPKGFKGVGYVDLGRPVAGVSLRIVNSEGQVVKDGEMGRLQIKGRVTTPGWLPHDQRGCVDDESEWLDSGDLGFLADGRLVLTGRDKQDWIVRGTNFNLHEIESVVAEVDGVLPGMVGATVFRDPENEEALAIFFCSNRTQPQAQVIANIRAGVAMFTGEAPRYILKIRPEQFPKTSVGKVRRGGLLELLKSEETVNARLEYEQVFGKTSHQPLGCFKTAWVRKNPRNQRLLEYQKVLILSDMAREAVSLASRLTTLGIACAIAEPGDDFGQIGSAHFSIRRAEVDDFLRLLQDQVFEEGKLDAIICMFGLGGSRKRPTPEIDDLLEASAGSFFTLSNALLQVREKDQNLLAEKVRVFFCADRTQAVLPTDRPIAARAAVVGLLATAHAEWDWLVCRHLDLTLDPGALVEDAILAELADRTSDFEIAWRKGLRFVRKLTAVETPQRKNPVSLLQRQHFYLITGGAGRFGRQLNRWLSTSVGVQTLVIGRTALDPASSDAEPGLYRQVDVTCFEALSRVVAETENALGLSLGGMFHLADNRQKRLLRDETLPKFLNGVRTKIHGALNLAKLTEQSQAPFLVCFSSVNGMFGGSGAGTYAAANRFLDHLALNHAGRGSGQIQSLAWSRLRFPEPEMTEDMALPGFQDIPVAKGLDLLSRFLGGDVEHVLLGLAEHHPRFSGNMSEPVVAARKLVAFASSQDPSIHTRPNIPLMDAFGKSVAYSVVRVDEIPKDEHGSVDTARLFASVQHPLFPRRVLPTTETERQVASLWSQVLGGDLLGRHCHFFARGGHSLAAVKTIAIVNQHFTLELPVRVLFQFPVLKNFASLLDQELGIQAGQPHATYPESVPELAIAANDGKDESTQALFEVEDVEEPTEIRASVHREEVEGVLRDLLKAVPDLRLETSFFQMGVDSLQVMQVAAGIRHHYGVELPLTHLFDNPTLGGLIDGVLVELGAHGEGRVALPECLIPINRSGSQPVFCVHPIAGSPSVYRTLATAMGEEISFWGFQAPGLTDRDKAFSSIEAMAAHYISAMRTIQPEGPYYLAGWSFGGIVAFEMARQLRSQQKAVAMVALIDNGIPAVKKGLLAPLAPLALAGFALSFLLKIKPPTSYRELRQQAGWVGISLPESPRHLWPWRKGVGKTFYSQAGRSVRVLFKHLYAVKKYKAKPIPGEVVLFRAQKKPRKRDPLIANVSQFAEVVACRMVTGNHMSIILNANHTQKLAQEILAALHERGFHLQDTGAELGEGP